MRNAVLIAFCLAASPALAETWAVDKAASSLTFEAKQADEAFKGSFPNFESEIDFSEAAPEKGRIHITVDIASATAEGKDRQDALPTKDWLNAAQFPKAEFTSTTIRKTGEHRFAAEGNLTIRGVTQKVTLPFTLSPLNGKTLAEGNITLSRNSYSIGQGQWASEQWVAYPVMVSYRIVASPVAAK